MIKIFQNISFIGLLLLFCTDLFAQGKIYDGPDDGAGDPHLEREGFMNGNRVQLLFKNNTELGDYPRKDAARWPIGVGGNVMHDGIALMVSAKVYIKDRTTPVSDMDEIVFLREQGRLDSLFFCQTNYREEMDRDDTGQIEWGLHPAPGYINNSSETPALSNDPNSWPTTGWPYTGRQLHWPGEWDGRFGRGQIRADLEAYVVANDAQDLEYLGDDDYVKYYPRPNLEIGGIDPRVTVQKGKPWGGVGIRVKQRGFQWNNPMAQDCIFWEYTIANTSDYDLPNVAFGYWIDNNIGGENTGEDGSFDKIEDMAYTWDTDGVGEDGYKTGTQGFAFLESPGIFNDDVDNDDDGLIDESRDNDAGNYLNDPMGGIVDLQKFLSFYGLKEEDLKPHWAGDEDQDWQDGEDENGNGVYESDEFAGDDVGLDGVSPGEENYYGPDADGTECNHKPDLGEGYAEPNFGWTDVSETDMLGLTTLLFDPIPEHVDPYLSWFRNDQSMWERMTYKDSLEEGASGIANLGELFSSAIFPLYKGRTEFISLAELHSYDDLSGLTSSEHAAPALFTLKKTVQVIYEKDYRFAQPPLMPKLTAVPGDGFVQLIWDNRADKSTREPILNNENDFEGYKVFRATDKDFTDPMIITDGYGTKTLMKPIFQCDKRNGKEGFTDYGLLNGMGYNLGDDTGLAYSFKDERVQNGRTYYYAVVAYDYGIPPGILKGSAVIAQDDKYGIAPSENNVVIRKDEFENVTFIGQNVAIVTPGTKAAGQIFQTEYNLDAGERAAYATIIPEVVAPNLLKKGHQYKIKFAAFHLDSLSLYPRRWEYQYITNGLYVYDAIENDKLVFSDIMVSTEYGIKRPRNLITALEFYDVPVGNDYYQLAYTEPRVTDVFDGIRLNVQMHIKTATFDSLRSGWMPGSSPIEIRITQYGEKFYPNDYNIIFSDDVLFTGITSTYSSGFYDADGNNYNRRQMILNQDFNFKVENLSVRDSLGNPELMDIVAYDVNDNDSLDIFEDLIFVGRTTNGRWEYTIFTIDFSPLAGESELPHANDVYALRFNRPFMPTDSIMFSINSEEIIDDNLVKQDMNEIKVVPNPYIATNVMEASVINKYLNQGRRLMFTHLPEKCTVKIFTVSGILVRELQFPDDALTGYNGFGDSSSGVLHWDMLTKEGLEIAAGMYIYYVKDERTGEEKIGKFGVIK
ncbi:MAG: hypothetical protein AMS23_00515 [Bacteroides sp. SM1_62]|nr:MAG: hypothetical protein AMS26_01160 [Bacteroides sp. SM23_62]KPL26722.1 MAG: hypothetical protein AMS23_00515 [Bacteroides sp. SM1_62]